MAAQIFVAPCTVADLGSPSGCHSEGEWNAAGISEAKDCAPSWAGLDRHAPFGWNVHFGKRFMRHAGDARGRRSSNQQIPILDRDPATPLSLADGRGALASNPANGRGPAQGVDQGGDRVGR